MWPPTHPTGDHDLCASAEAARLAREIDTSLQAGLTSEEREQLLRLLQRVATD